ncbi:hypothetical protein F4703DRAFT_1788694 [Phycomyces blakesleeanus]
MDYPYDLTQPLSSSFSPPSSLFLDNGSKTTLWMGELEPWMDEQVIRQLWFNLNEKVMVKVIRDKMTSTSAGYAFVDFGSTSSAFNALNTYNGALIPNTHKPFKLNWASGGGLIDRREDRQPEYSIFVGDLSPEVNESGLLVIFQTRYRSCKSAKIMTDPRTSMSRGYGFVRFSDPVEQQHALVEMQGVFLGSRPIRVSVATPKNSRAGHAQYPALSPTSSLPSSPSTRSPPLQQQLMFTDPTNTTVFVGGLSAPISEEGLQQYFSSFGEIIYVKIPTGKGCGFVQYVSRQSAEMAIQEMNGYQIGNSRIRLSWGRSQQTEQKPLPVPPTLPRNSAFPYNPLAYTTFSSIQQQLQPTMNPPQPTFPSHVFSPHQRHQQQSSFDNTYRNDTLDLLRDTDNLFSTTLLDKKTSSNASAWRFNQIYAQ